MDFDSLTYQLPAEELDSDAIQLDVEYEMLVFQYPASLSAMVSNSFFVTFTSTSAPGTSTGSSNQSPSSSSLSRGAAAGIVIGTLLGVVILALLGFFPIRPLCRRFSSSNSPPSYNR